MGERPGAETAEGRPSLAGFRHIAASPVLLPIVASWTIMFFAVDDIAYVADLPLAKLFAAGSFGFGLLTSLAGVGGVLGALAGGACRSAGRDLPSCRVPSASRSAMPSSPSPPPFRWRSAAKSWPASPAATVASRAPLSCSGLLPMLSVAGSSERSAWLACLPTSQPFFSGHLLVGSVGARGVYLVGAALALPAGLVMLSGIRALRLSQPQAEVEKQSLLLV